MSIPGHRKASGAPPDEESAGRTAARQGLAASVLTGLAFIAVFPPFTIADEPAHFYRAYLLSEGRLHVTLEMGRAGAMLPSSLATVVERSLVGLVRNPDAAFDTERWRAIRAIPLEPESRGFLEFPSSGMLPFLAYIPQAIGIAFGRAFSAPPVVLLYLGRLANLLVASWLMASALKMLPGWRWPLLLVALSPAAISLRASLSPDALTFALTLSAAACIFRHAFEGQRGSTPHGLAPGLAAAAALCLTKLPYCLLLLSGLPHLRRLRRGRRLAALALALVVTAPPLAYSAWCAARVDQPLRSDLRIDREGQIRRAVTEPGHFLLSTGRTFLRQGPRLVADLWGARLGWLDVRTPRAIPWLLGTIFLALLLLDRPPSGRLQGLDVLALAAATASALLAISLSQYATWTSPSDHLVRGLQGRYFLPVVPFVAGLIGSLFPSWIDGARLRRATIPITWATLALADTLTIAAVCLRFWVF